MCKINDYTLPWYDVFRQKSFDEVSLLPDGLENVAESPGGYFGITNYF